MVGTVSWRDIELDKRNKKSQEGKKKTTKWQENKTKNRRLKIRGASFLSEN